MRKAFPTRTSATCSTKIGTPFDAPMTTFRMSSTEAIRPTPRTMSHAPFASSTFPPTFTLLSRTARDDGAEGQVVLAKAIGIDVDLILLDVSSDRCHLGHARDGVELIADEPVLQGPQLAE